MLWLPELHPGPHWGSLQRSPDSLAEISNLLFEKMLWKSNSELVTPINIICDCIKGLFMLVIALCMVYFFRVKINKKLWPPYF